MGGHLAMSENIFDCRNWGGGVLLACRGKMLLSILQYAGQLPTTKNCPAPDANRVLRLSNPGPEPRGTEVKERIYLR